MEHNNIALVVDSTSRYSDIWKMYFGELDKFFPKEIKKYLFTDTYNMDLGVENMTPIFYNNIDSYRNQFLECLKQVKEEYIIYNSEDYVLFNKVELKDMVSFMNVLENDKNYDFIRFISGEVKRNQYSDDYPNLHVIDQNDTHLFSQSASIWKTKSFFNVFEASPAHNGRMQQEPQGSDVCRRIGINGLLYSTGKEIKRGRHHYDSLVFPYIATAISKGKWNGEYSSELTELLKKYDVNPDIRGWIN